MRKKQNYQWKEMSLGTCYYPEHWDRKLWREDLDRMLANGEDTVSLLVQLNAAKSALMKVGEMLLEDSIESRLGNLGATEADKEKSLTEIRRFFSMN